MKPGTELTAERAREFGIDPQGENETDSTFRHRVGATLRSLGYVVEAHEALQNALYDGRPDG